MTHRRPPPVGTRRSNDRLWVLLIVAVAAAAMVAAVAAHTGGGAAATPRAVRWSTLPGVLTGKAPWPRNVAELRARLAALGLPALAREGTALHIHEHLDVYVDGRHIGVPAGIGIDENGGFISPLHTHDDSGVIHVESPRVRTFTLGELFGVWGVQLTRRCLGGYCASHGKRVRVFVNGRLVTANPDWVVLSEHQEIVVAYGTHDELPRPLPTRFDFPSGL